MSSFLAAPTVSVAINPTPTEVERWQGSAEVFRLCFENTDVAQVYQCWIETRPNIGSGTFSNTGETQWTDVQPLEARDRDVGELGAGEFRFMAQAIGAGGNALYSRRFVRKGA